MEKGFTNHTATKFSANSVQSSDTGHAHPTICPHDTITNKHPPTQGTVRSYHLKRTSEGPNTRGRRRRSLASQRQQHSLAGSNEGLTGREWELMASVDAATILKMNIVALDKPPAKYKTLWRQAVAEVNSAGNSPNEQTRKGAEITLALLPNMLLRAPSAQERLMSTRQKMDIRFAKFFSGQLSILVEDIQLSSTRRREEDGIRIPHVFSESTYQEKAIIRADKLAQEGQIGRAVNSLESSPPAPATPETYQQLVDLHPAPIVPIHTAIPSGTPRNTYIPSDKAFISAIKNAPSKIRAGPTNWTYDMLKSTLSNDPSSDISAVKDALVKFCSGNFHPDTIHLFKLAWMFAFLKNEAGDKRPVVAGDTLRKTAGKAMAIDLRIQWKESAGPHQYGLNTADGVNMVVLMVTDTLQQNLGHCATAVDGQNAFNAMRRQKILDRLFITFPQLAIFVECWYLDPSPLWYYMQDHTVRIIWSREGVQQGDVIATFLFSNTLAPTLYNIYTRITPLCPTAQLLAILDDITLTGPVHLTTTFFQICTEELASLGIRTVPRKSHVLVNPQDQHLLPNDLNPEVNIHNDGISLLGTAIGSDDYLQNFFQTKLQKIDRLLAKVTRINSTHCKYHMVRFSVNAKLRHLLRSLPVSRRPVKDFCVQFDQTILNFMFRELNIPSPSDTMLL